MSVDYHIERTNEGMVVVDQAESFLPACIDCAPARRAIGEALRDACLPVPRAPANPRIWPRFSLDPQNS